MKKPTAPQIQNNTLKTVLAISAPAGVFRNLGGRARRNSPWCTALGAVTSGENNDPNSDRCGGLGKGVICAPMVESSYAIFAVPAS